MCTTSSVSAQSLEGDKVRQLQRCVLLLQKRSNLQYGSGEGGGRECRCVCTRAYRFKYTLRIHAKSPCSHAKSSCGASGIPANPGRSVGEHKVRITQCLPPRTHSKSPTRHEKSLPTRKVDMQSHTSKSTLKGPTTRTVHTQNPHAKSHPTRKVDIQSLWRLENTQSFGGSKMYGPDFFRESEKAKCVSVCACVFIYTYIRTYIPRLSNTLTL